MISFSYGSIANGVETVENMNSFVDTFWVFTLQKLYNYAGWLIEVPVTCNYLGMSLFS